MGTTLPTLKSSPEGTEAGRVNVQPEEVCPRKKENPISRVQGQSRPNKALG